MFVYNTSIHLGYLAAPLLNVRLVDTNSIGPQDPVGIVLSQIVQRCCKICRGTDGLNIDLN